MSKNKDKPVIIPSNTTIKKGMDSSPLGGDRPKAPNTNKNQRD